MTSKSQVAALERLAEGKLKEVAMALSIMREDEDVAGLTRIITALERPYKWAQRITTRARRKSGAAS